MLKKFYQLVFIVGFFYLGLLSYLSFQNYESLKLDPATASNTGYVLSYASVAYLVIYIGSLFAWRERKCDSKESTANLIQRVKSKDEMLPWETLQDEMNEPLLDN